MTTTIIVRPGHKRCRVHENPLSLGGEYDQDTEPFNILCRKNTTRGHLTFFFACKPDDEVLYPFMEKLNCPPQCFSGNENI